MAWTLGKTKLYFLLGGHFQHIEHACRVGKVNSLNLNGIYWRGPHLGLLLIMYCFSGRVLSGRVHFHRPSCPASTDLHGGWTLRDHASVIEQN